LAALNRAVDRSKRNTTRQTPEPIQPESTSTTTRKASTKHAAKPRAAARRSSAIQTRNNRRGSNDTGAQEYRSYLADCKSQGRSPSPAHNVPASLDADIDRIKSEDKRLGHPRAEAACATFEAAALSEGVQAKKGGLRRQVSELREENPGALYSTSLALAAQRSCPEGLVPWPVRDACQWLREHALGCEGIFRIPGSRRLCTSMIKQYDTEADFQLAPDEKPNNVCSLLVRYIQGLAKAQEALWGPSLQEGMAFQTEVTCFRKKRMNKHQVTAAIKAMVQKLPPANQATLKEVAGMLHEACKPQWADSSKMDSKKFGLCLMPAIQGALMAMTDNYDEIFS